MEQILLLVFIIQSIVGAQVIEREIFVKQKNVLQRTSEDDVSPLYRTSYVFKVKSRGTPLIVLSDIANVDDDQGQFIMFYLGKKSRRGKEVYIRDSCMSCQAKKTVSVTFDYATYTTLWLKWNNKGRFRLGLGDKLGKGVILDYTSDKVFPIQFSQVTSLKLPTTFKFMLDAVPNPRPDPETGVEIVVSKLQVFKLTTDFGVSPLYRSSYVIEMRSCGSLVLMLSDIAQVTNTGRYVVLQFSKGKEVQLLDNCFLCPAKKTVPVKYICTEYSAFWFTWDNKGGFCVGKGTKLNKDLLIDYTSENSFPVRFSHVTSKEKPASFKFLFPSEKQHISYIWLKHTGKRIVGSKAGLSARDQMSCGFYCLQHATCRYFNYNNVDGHDNCQLFSANNVAKLQTFSDWDVYCLADS